VLRSPDGRRIPYPAVEGDALHADLEMGTY